MFKKDDKVVFVRQSDEWSRKFKMGTVYNVIQDSRNDEFLVKIPNGESWYVQLQDIKLATDEDPYPWCG